jgi:hypothetical protein
VRGYVTVTARQAGRILEHGWEDIHGAGVFVCAAPLGPEDGVGGEVRLCLDLPKEDWELYDVTSLGFLTGERLAHVPAGVLNRLGPPRLYDHRLFNGYSRRALVQLMRRREAAGPDGYPGLQDMRDAMRLFDLVGWRSAVRLRENA